MSIFLIERLGDAKITAKIISTTLPTIIYFQYNRKISIILVFLKMWFFENFDFLFWMLRRRLKNPLKEPERISLLGGVYQIYFQVISDYNSLIRKIFCDFACWEMSISLPEYLRNVKITLNINKNTFWGRGCLFHLFSSDFLQR